MLCPCILSIAWWQTCHPNKVQSMAVSIPKMIFLVWQNLKWQKIPAKCVKKIPSALLNICDITLYQNGIKKFTFSNCIFCHFKFCHNRKISSGSILRDLALKTLLCASILCFATDIFRTFGPYFLWICRACGLLIRLQKHPKQFGFQHAQCQSRFLFFSKSVTK